MKVEGSIARFNAREILYGDGDGDGDGDYGEWGYGLLFII